MPSHRLVDGVIHDLVDEMVQAHLAGRADVHRRPFADAFKTFEDADRSGVVLAGFAALAFLLLAHQVQSLVTQPDSLYVSVPALEVLHEEACSNNRSRERKEQ